MYLIVPGLILQIYMRTVRVKHVSLRIWGRVFETKRFEVIYSACQIQMLHTKLTSGNTYLGFASKETGCLRTDDPSTSVDLLLRETQPTLHAFRHCTSDELMIEKHLTQKVQRRLLQSPHRPICVCDVARERKEEVALK